jgi:hypothetical protein
MQKRRHFTHTVALRERLVEQARLLREKAKMLPLGPEREHLIRKARQDETAADIDAWLNSSGLKPPT